MRRKKILVPVDISRDTANLLMNAGRLAQDIQGRLSCLAVIDDSEVLDEADSAQQRRKVEIELSQRVNAHFTQGKPEFDIIVTRGKASERIVQISGNLNIDLLIMQANHLPALSQALFELKIPSVILFGQLLSGTTLLLPVNLNASYYQNIQDSIDICLLLNASLKVVSYIDTPNRAKLYKEKVDDIKRLVEKENVPCMTTMRKNPGDGELILKDLLQTDTDSIPILWADELRMMQTLASQGEGLTWPGVVLAPGKMPAPPTVSL